MAVSDADGIVYYRFVYDTYGGLSDITTDDGVSLKSSEQLTEYRLAELAHANVPRLKPICGCRELEMSLICVMIVYIHRIC